VTQVLRPSVGSMGIEAIEIHRHHLPRDRSDVLVSIGLGSAAVPPPRPDADGALETLTDGRLIVDQALRVFGPDRGRIALVLRVVARRSPWTDVADWTTTLVLAGGLGLVLLVLGGVLLEVQVLRPLRAVRAAADEVAGGRLDAEVPTQGPAEFSALATAFNRMTTSLRTQIERNAAQRESLVRSEQLASVGRLSAGVAHEVGNPLAAILGYVELLLDPRTEPSLVPEQRSLLERSRTQLERIQSIVGQLLDYSRPPQSTVESIDLLDTSRRLIALLRHDPRCHGVELSVEGDDHLLARVDPAHFDQVLQNLLVNASRAALAAESPAAVVVRIVGHADTISIEVQDTGLGVPDDLRPQLFEPFVTTARAGEGTGLGLAIAAGLVEGMGGELRCLDPSARPPLREGASPGAVFVVKLPRAGHGAPSAPSEHASANADSSAHVQSKRPKDHDDA
ncbi:MAG: HAMP domain-containing histidine kinase, partial [Deltaproteobacteria bacterium]|nr:HAMP domain-containing histidine kinase [Deltaproteobacteria bacterium]